MAINPLLLAGIVGTGGELIQQAPKIIPSQFDKEQKRKLEALKKREEMGLLGLSEQERNVLEGRLSSRAKQASDYANAQRNQLLAGSGVQAGAAMQQAVLVDEARARAEIGIQQSVEEQDLAEKNREVNEVRALEAAVAQRKEEQKQAVANVLGSGFDSVVGATAQGKLIQGSQGPSPSSINVLVQRYGMSDVEARGLLELSAENPDLLKYLDRMED
jgi:hypothetical protein